MARKLEASVVSTVVGARRDALHRFLELRSGAGVAAATLDWSGSCCAGDAPTPAPWETAADGGEEENVTVEGKLVKGRVESESKW